MTILALGTFLSTHGPLHHAKPKDLEEPGRSYVSEVNSVGCMFMTMTVTVLPYYLTRLLILYVDWSCVHKT